MCFAEGRNEGGEQVGSNIRLVAFSGALVHQGRHQKIESTAEEN